MANWMPRVEEPLVEVVPLPKGVHYAVTTSTHVVTRHDGQPVITTKVRALSVSFVGITISCLPDHATAADGADDNDGGVEDGSEDVHL